MRMGDAARVGAAVLAAAVLLVFATFSLRGSLAGAGTYLQPVSFANALGIQKGAYVRVRGVDMGSVEAIGLGADGSAVLTLRMLDRYRIASADGIRIVGGLFSFSPPYVEITPGARREPASPGSVLQGQSGTSTDELLSQGETLLGNLNRLTVRMTQLTDNFSNLVGDPRLQRNLVRTVENVGKVSATGVLIARNIEAATAKADRLIASFNTTSARLDSTMRQAEAVMTAFRGTAEESRGFVRDARSLVASTGGVVKDAGTLVQSADRAVQQAGGAASDLRLALAENRERLRSVLDNLNGALKQLDGTLVEARSFLADQELRGNLKATSESLRDATANLKKITDDVRVLTGDPRVQEDLKVTIGGLRSATEEASEVFQQVREVLGGGGKAARTIGERLSDVALDVTPLRAINQGRNRVDLDATFPWTRTTHYRLGFFDLGEGNKLNVQAGRTLRPGFAARFGFHASKLGLGFDFGNRLHPAFAVDIYGVDRTRVDARGALPLTSYFDITLGLDNVTKRADPTVGVRYRR